MSFEAGALFCTSINVLIIDLFSNKFLNAFFGNFDLPSLGSLKRHISGLVGVF